MTTPNKALPTATFAPQEAAAQQRVRDSEHLRLLAIVHLIVGGLAGLMVPFLGLYCLFFYVVFTVMPYMPVPNQEPPPTELLLLMMWIFPIVAIFFAAAATLNLLSGWFLYRRTHRVFSFVVAGLDCLWIPWGTLLAVFTILVLTRPSVQKMYEVGPPVRGLSANARALCDRPCA